MIPTRILYLWSGKEDSINEQLTYSIYSLFYLSHALMEQKPKDPIWLLYIYDKADTFGAAVSGFAKTIRLENPKFVYKTLGIEDFDTSFVLDKAFKEFDDLAVEVCYEGEQRQIKVFKEFDIEHESVNELPLKEGGVYLITGGLGGLGLIFADYLAKKWKANLVLCGRSDLSSENETILKKIEEESSAEVEYIKADLSKQEAVQKLISQAKSRFNRIDGIIHAAGVIKDAFILKKTKEEIDTVLAAKVHSTIYLDEATKDEELDFFVFFSSIASAMGNAGQCDYAYANSFMDNFVELRNALTKDKKRSGKALSINWSLWKEGGMHVDEQTEKWFIKTMGINVLPTKEGINAFERGLAINEDLFIVLKGKANKIRRIFEQRKAEAQIDESPDVLVDDADIFNKVQKGVIKIASDILKVKEQNIEPDVEMSEYGFDSISLTELVNKINEEYNLEIMPSIFFEHPSIDSFSGYLCGEYKDNFVRYYQDSLVGSEKVFIYQNILANILLI